MKSIMIQLSIHLALTLVFVSNIATCQNDEKAMLEGAWTSLDSEGNISHLIINNGFFSVAEYSKTSFIRTYGGSFKTRKDEFQGQIEFNSTNSSLVGQELRTSIRLSPQKELAFNEKNWKRIDDNTPGALSGAWIITGRMRDGEMTERKPGPRKTMKILSGTRFQWIAYHTENGQFMGTGGGAYKTEGGSYTESIEFFSRDQSRVGAVLGFKFELMDGQWHHQGKSSKGADIYEVWSLR